MSDQNLNIRINEDEKYAQISNPIDERIETIISNIGELYPGFTVDICYQNQPHPADILAKIGANMIDDSIELHLKSENFAPVAATGISFLAENEFAEFAALHSQRHPDMYWTSQRVAANRHAWNIFASRTGGKITGYLLAINSTHEILCVSSSNLDESRRLLCAAISEAFKVGAADVLCMAERGDEKELEAAKSLGFAESGYYRGFRVIV